jgi:hypothetical protein
MGYLGRLPRLGHGSLNVQETLIDGTHEIDQDFE